MPKLSANILDRRGFAMVAAITAGTLFTSRFGAAWAADEAPKAAAADIFTAEGVPVDVSAANVNDARDRGLVQGRVNGLRKVLERLVSREDLARVPTLSSTQIIELVRDFSIANERSSNIRYIAELTVRYDPAGVRKLLRGAGIAFAETVSKPLVVVPVLRSGGRNLLWEDANPWRAAWIKTASPNSLVPLTVPSDPKEMALTADQALAKDPAALAALANANNAGGVLLAVADMSGRQIQVTLSEIRPGFPNQDFTTAGPDAGSQDDQFTGAARAAANAVQDSWRQRSTVTSGVNGQLTALVTIETLKDWLSVRDRLSAVPLIERVDLQAITRDRAQVTLYYAGQQDQLRLAMTQRDLTLVQQGSVWVIAVARAR